jgi:hypothetical protein
MSRDELMELGAQMQKRFKAALSSSRIGSDLERMSTGRARRALAA